MGTLTLLSATVLLTHIFSQITSVIFQLIFQGPFTIFPSKTQSPHFAFVPYHSNPQRNIEEAWSSSRLILTS